MPRVFPGMICFKSILFIWSFATEPWMPARVKPSPTSTAFTEPMLIRALARSASILSKTGSPRPCRGNRGQLISTTPPSESFFFTDYRIFFSITAVCLMIGAKKRIVHKQIFSNSCPDGICHGQSRLSRLPACRQWHQCLSGQSPSAAIAPAATRAGCFSCGGPSTAVPIADTVFLQIGKISLSGTGTHPLIHCKRKIRVNIVYNQRYRSARGYFLQKTPRKDHLSLSTL